MLTLNDPQGQVVWVVTSVPFVIERKLFDCAVPDVEIIQFVVKIPRAATPSA